MAFSSACDNQVCANWGILDRPVHAWVVDGTDVKYDRIEDLLCQGV